MSARRVRSSIDSWLPARRVAMPIDTPRSGNGSGSDSLQLRWARSCRSRRPAPPRSCGPRRSARPRTRRRPGGQSDRRAAPVCAASRRAGTSTLSPTACPSRSLTALKASRSTNISVPASFSRSRRAMWRCTSSRKARRLSRPVSGSVRGLVDHLARDGLVLEDHADDVDGRFRPAACLPRPRGALCALRQMARPALAPKRVRQPTASTNRPSTVAVWRGPAGARRNQTRQRSEGWRTRPVRIRAAPRPAHLRQAADHRGPFGPQRADQRPERGVHHRIGPAFLPDAGQDVARALRPGAAGRRSARSGRRGRSCRCRCRGRRRSRRRRRAAGRRRR